MSADNRTPHTDALATLGMIHTQKEGRDAIHLGVEQVVAGETLERGQPIGLGPDGKAYSSWFGCEGSAAYNTPKCVGIVDPFLDQAIYKGQKFWLVVLPRQITSLRHVWEHPDFPASGETGGAELLTRKIELPAPAKPVEKMSKLELTEHIKVMEAVVANAATNPGPTKEQVHKAELLLGIPEAIARQHLMDVAGSLGVDYDELIERAGDYVHSGEYWVDGGRFEGESIGDPDKFWSAYETITGKVINPNDRGNFLSCSC